MEKSSVDWTIKSIGKRMDDKEVSFDYPIQRPSGQWNALQQSLLVHSVLVDFPLPPLYLTNQVEEDESGEKTKIGYILDGKQRMTNLKAFVENEFALHEETPKVKYRNKNYEVAGMLFADLPEDLQDKILDYNLTIYKLEDITDEEIEDLFYRLNNGTPLSKQHQAKAKMGTEWANILKEIMGHQIFEFAKFTPLQKKKADDEVAVVQTMMMLDEKAYPYWDSISSADVAKYISTFKDDKENKLAILEKIKKAFTYIAEAFGEEEKLVLKKVHFPMTVQTALYAIEKGVSKQDFDKWRFEFKKSYEAKIKGYIPTDYKKSAGQGSVKKAKAEGRLKAMKAHLDNFMSEDFQKSLVEKEKAEKAEKEAEAKKQAEAKKAEAEKKKAEAEAKKVEPKKAEPKKAEPKKAEPKKAEPKKAEPKKTEVKKVEPKKTEVKKVEPKKAEVNIDDVVQNSLLDGLLGGEDELLKELESGVTKK